MIDQQLTVIDQLERDEQDPQRLAKLFRLDHLAARMRRNGANLLVLAGTNVPHEQGEPVPVTAVINAAAALDGDRLTRERALSAAKVTIGRIGALVAEESIQMHGGIGMTWELPLSHYAKRLVMIDHELGDEDHHLARFMALGRETAQ